MLPFILLSILTILSFCRAAWVNFDTWESRSSYEQFSHYETLDYHYRNPLFTSSPLLFDTLEPTTETRTPRFLKRKYLTFKNYVNKTLYKYSVPQKFDRFDKHRIIRGCIRQIQKFLYLNAPEERVHWFDNSESSGHMDVATYSDEGPYLGWNKDWHPKPHHRTTTFRVPYLNLTGDTESSAD